MWGRDYCTVSCVIVEILVISRLISYQHRGSERALDNQCKTWGPIGFCRIVASNLRSDWILWNWFWANFVVRLVPVAWRGKSNDVIGFVRIGEQNLWSDWFLQHGGAKPMVRLGSVQLVSKICGSSDTCGTGVGETCGLIGFCSVRGQNLWSDWFL